MAEAGNEIRLARIARGMSQAALARAAGVSSKTISRIESGADYNDPRSIPAVRRAVGLDGDDEDGPPLKRASAAELISEIGSRLAQAERDRERLRRAGDDLPADWDGRQNTIMVPVVGHEHRGESNG